MGFTFVGSKTHELWNWCNHCEEEYDQEDQHEHEECELVADYQWEILDDSRPFAKGIHKRNYSCVGVMGPGERDCDIEDDYPWIYFRLKTNDELVLFHGKIAGRYTGHEPLEDFGREQGCCIIEYKVKGEWIKVPV